MKRYLRILVALIARRLRPMDQNTMLFYGALVCLFVGAWLKFDVGTALIVLGAVSGSVSAATAFFITGLSARIGQREKK